MITGRIYWR
jgi:hypothetical protein